MRSRWVNCHGGGRKIVAARVCRKKKGGGGIYSRTFATDTYGDKLGRRLGHNSWQPTEGPFLEKGYSCFTEKSELVGLFPGFKLLETELLTRTVNSMEN